MNQVLAPISIGELFDKISILEIKLDHVGKDESKLVNIQKELYQLNEIKDNLKIVNTIEIEELYNNLKQINFKLWKIEDLKRDHEKKQVFDQEFVNLSRKVYLYNDNRAELKRKINILLNSDIIEEKIY